MPEVKVTTIWLWQEQ